MKCIYQSKITEEIRMNRNKHSSQGNDLPLPTSVETAGNLIAENLHMTSENADFNGLLHSCNSEGLIQKIEK